MAEHLFLTGGTGFIGSRLCRVWLERTSARITLLVRRRPTISDQDRIGRLLSAFPADERAVFGARIGLVSGDLALPGLGMNEFRTADLAESVTHIVHAGAELRFNLTLERARRTNTSGTAAILEFARRCPRLASFQYVSTAYVAGRRKGVIHEEEGDGATLHNNTYERSKFEAEALVREAMAEIPASVLRPSIVTCGLEDGYAPRTSAFFRLLQGIATGALDVLPGRPDTQLDLVPVDYVVEAGYAMGRRPGSAGQIFHLSAGSENLISLGEVSGMISESFGRKPVAILTPREFEDWTRGARRAKPQLGAFMDEVESYAPYLYDHPFFDDGNARSALAHQDLPTRWFPDYYDRVVGYIRDNCSPDRRD